MQSTVYLYSLSGDCFSSIMSLDARLVATGMSAVVEEHNMVDGGGLQVLVKEARVRSPPVQRYVRVRRVGVAATPPVA